MFKVAGVSLCKGQMKVRWASDMTRIKVLVKTGHTDINLVELPEAMDKGQAVTFLKTTDLYNKAEYREAIDAADSKYNGVGEVKVTVKKAQAADKVKATKPAKSAPNLADIKQRVEAAKTSTKETSSKESSVVEAA